MIALERVLVIAACIGVLVASGVVIFQRQTQTDAAAEFVRIRFPTPREIERCEQDIVAFTTWSFDPDRNPAAARGMAVSMNRCDEIGLVARSLRRMIEESPAGPDFKALQDDPFVFWRR